MSVHEIDVLISDQAMPGSDGVELMRELQSVHQNVRVVAISGSYLEKSMLPTSKLDGACAILPRPYRLSELADAITGAA
jgi:DNA-binding NarL/FixJ family response regulator